MKRCVDALTADRFDLVVLGAGITGAGVALDAALRGLRVALLDKGDFASGTSSMSSKLVHGGLRYLEQAQFALVYEALHERSRLLRNAPHLVWPLPFTLPYYAESRVPAWKWRLGLTLYDLLAGRSNLAWSRGRTAAWLAAQHPALRRQGLVGGAEYVDAQMDDARVCLEVVHSAAEHGAVVCNYVEAIRLEGSAVRAVDHGTGREVLVRGQMIVNTTGPWSDEVRRLTGQPIEEALAPTKGVHLVAPDQQFPSAYLLLHPRDGRVFFVLPWLGKTVLGTTDTDCSDSPDALSVTDEDVDYLLEGFEHYFPGRLTRSQLLGSFAGVRPLVRTQPGDPSSRSREWRVVESPSGLISVVGGKYTTYRQMAEKITDLVMRRLHRTTSCRTRMHRLYGAPNGSWPEYRTEAVATLSRRWALPEEVASHLVGRYGRRVGEVVAYLAQNREWARPILDGEPDILVELVYQREQEMACRLEDHLLRRTRLGLFYPALLRSARGTAIGSVLADLFS